MWVRRLHVELDAAARFSRLSRQLSQCGGRAEVTDAAVAAADDERRHATLCERLIDHFGGVVPHVAVAEARPIARPGMDARERLLYEIVALCCVTETLSTALLGGLCDEATDTVAAVAMRSILKDEVRHSQLGWAHLAAEHEAGARDVVGRHLPAMLAETVREELFSGAAEHPLQAELDGLGSLGRAKRKHIFTETMRQVVFPGLSRFGVDTSAGERWMDAQIAEVLPGSAKISRMSD